MQKTSLPGLPAGIPTSPGIDNPRPTNTQIQTSRQSLGVPTVPAGTVTATPQVSQQPAVQGPAQPQAARSAVSRDGAHGGSRTWHGAPQAQSAAQQVQTPFGNVDVPDVQTSPPDEDGNTTTTITNSDGSQDVIVSDANGNFVSSHRVNPDGTIEEPTDGPTTAPGTTTEPGNGGRPQHVPPDARVDANGDHVWTDANGDVNRVEASTGDRLRREPDGTIYRRSQDGSVTRRNPDGTVTRRNPDGSRVRKNPDGSSVRVDAAGNVTRTAAPATTDTNETETTETDTTGPGPSNRPQDLNVLQPWNQPLEEVLPPRPDFDPLEGPQTPLPEYVPGEGYVAPEYEAGDPLATTPYERGDPLDAPGYEAGDTFDAPEYQSPDQFVAPTMAEVMERPGYKFGLEQGQIALENSAASRGILRHGNTMREMLKYGSDYATTKYDDSYKRMLGEWKTMQDEGRYAHEQSYRGTKDEFTSQVDERRYAHDADYRKAIDEFTSQVDERRYAHDARYRAEVDEYMAAIDEGRYDHEQDVDATKTTYQYGEDKRRYEQEQAFERARILRAEEAEREAMNAALERGDYNSQYNQSTAEWEAARNTYWTNQGNAFDRTRWQAELGLV